MVRITVPVLLAVPLVLTVLGGCGGQELDFDRDDDGIQNGLDECPDAAEVVNDFHDDDGCPDSPDDLDDDGILNASDSCPERPETLNAFMDSDGCPDFAPSAFAGTWDGSATLSPEGQTPATTPRFTVGRAPSGPEVTLCGEGLGFVGGAYDGDALSWTATVACPGVTWEGQCTIFEFTSGTASLATGKLEVVAQGVMRPCSASSPSVPFTYRFSGTRSQ